jgi:methyltransferase (TIGR00027 family)
VFASIDFNEQSLSDVLVEAGYQNGQQSLFLWEGVTMYLNPGAVDSTLAFIRDSSQSGSQAVFDYVYGSVLRRENSLYGEKEIFDTVSRAGEGWTFGIENGQIGEFLTERGFKLIAHYSATDLESKYFQQSDGNLVRRINGTHCIVQAGVV